MDPNRQRSRRSFLAQAIGGSVAGAVAVVLGGSSLNAQPGAQVGRMRVDADPSDPAYSGLTDSDSGANADPPEDGRGGPGARRRGVSDTDEGAGADPVRRGRGPARRRRTQGDADPTDPEGRRRGRRRGPSDSDTGPSADQPGGPILGAPRPAPGPPGGGPPGRFVICPGNRRCRR